MSEERNPCYFSDIDPEDRQNQLNACSVCGAAVHTRWEQRHVNWHEIQRAEIDELVEYLKRLRPPTRPAADRVKHLLTPSTLD